MLAAACPGAAAEPKFPPLTGRIVDAYATTGSVEQSYKVACEEFGQEPRAHTQFWKYLKQLEGAGFLLSRLSGKGQAGTTQLSREQIKQLEDHLATFLADVPDAGAAETRAAIDAAAAALPVWAATPAPERARILRRVADYDAWPKVYDSVSDMQRDGG